MLQQAVVNIVDYCTRYAAQIIGIAALLGLATANYAAGHFAIDTDVYKLISKELPSSMLRRRNWQPKRRRS